MTNWRRRSPERTNGRMISMRKEEDTPKTADSIVKTQKKIPTKEDLLMSANVVAKTRSAKALEIVNKII